MNLIQRLRDEEEYLTIYNNDGELSHDPMGNPPEKFLSFEKELGIYDVHHKNAEREAGFDLTDFEDAGDFDHVLQTVGLNVYRNYYRLESENGCFLFIWAGEGGMILTGNNPITGAYRKAEERPPEEGYASYITIEGDEKFVEEAIRAIKDTAKFYKDYNPENRDFI